MNIEEKLKSLKLKKSNLTKLKSELLDQKKRLSEENDKFEELTVKLDKEYKDFKKLDNLSIASLFSSISGNKEEKLEKEKQEYLQAKLNYDKSKETLNFLRERIEFIKSELNNTKEEDIEKEYQEILKEKEKFIISSEHKKSKELLEIADKITEVEINIKEIKEAIKSGELVNANFSMILINLDSAKKWGTYDTLGGETTSTHIKRQKINEANSLVGKSQYLIKNYAKELKDVNLSTAIKETLNIGDFEMFADYFFDGFIIDFIVHDKINTAISSVTVRKNKIIEVQNKLKSQLTEYKNKKEELEKIRTEIIENV
ncbi:MAG: hypothetical protein JXL97_04370 [Bacteroidales bacterium]|nr:hypothetical protein [Bacteroidales bacterium]